MDRLSANSSIKATSSNANSTDRPGSPGTTLVRNYASSSYVNPQHSGVQINISLNRLEDIMSRMSILESIQAELPADIYDEEKHALLAALFESELEGGSTRAVSPPRLSTDPQNLEEATHRHANCAPEGPERFDHAALIAFDRFARLGEVDSLNLAISLFRRAVDMTPDEDPEKPRRLRRLGMSAIERLELLREIDDMDQAVSSLLRAVELVPKGDPEAPTYLSCLAQYLSVASKIAGEPSDPDPVFSLLRQAIDLTPKDHPSMATLLNHLGLSTMKRFRAYEKFEDLEEGISLFRRAIELLPNDSFNAPTFNNLGSALAERFDLHAELHDLDEAIRWQRQALHATPDNHNSRSPRLLNLSFSLKRRFEALGEQHDFDDALNYCKECVEHTGGAPHERLTAANYASELCLAWPGSRAGLQDTLFGFYEHAFRLVPEAVWLGSSIRRRYDVLRTVDDLVNGAFAACVATGNLKRAVEWIDHGRGIVWGQLFQLRNQVDELSDRDSDLAQRLQLISRQLEMSAEPIVTIPAPLEVSSIGATMPNDTGKRIDLLREYEYILAKIRALKGFEGFLMPKSFDELACAARDGPIIIVNVHESRCDALVISSEADQPILVPLPELTPQLAELMRLQFEDSLTEASVRKRMAASTVADADDSASPYTRGALHSSLDENSQLLDVLTFLWSAVVHPIFQFIESTLDHYTVDTLPHVTWCATGPLAFLPLHAAGEYGSANGGLKAFDFVISSYTPILSPLLNPPVHAPDLLSTSTKILVVTQPDTPGYSSLPGSLHEAERLAAHFPRETVIHLTGKDATVNAVQQVLDENRSHLLHLACHGLQEDRSDPRNSAFALHDGLLDLSKIISKPIDGGVLAFLSACQTATGVRDLSGEAAHLAAGMLAAGYRGVIGTMWSIGDEDAPLVADVFYRFLKDDQIEAGGITKRLRAAHALHEAMNVLRDTVGVSNVMRWAPFIHLGL